MKTAEKKLQEWSNAFANPPRLNQTEAMFASLAAAAFLVMAVLQIISFSDFKDALGGLGLSIPATWALVLIVAEVWAALGFLKIKLPELVRYFSAIFTVFAAGFWMVQAMQTAIADAAVTNIGLFGKYLTQAPSWWTVIETSVLLFVVVYVLNRSRA